MPHQCRPYRSAGTKLALIIKKLFVQGDALEEPHLDNYSSRICSFMMGIPFDYVQERPEHIDAILNGLDRYNPETTAVFQDYVTQQCEEKTYDCYANLALLKL